MLALEALHCVVALSAAGSHTALLLADVFSKFHSSVWGKKLARRKTREGLTDFERFTAARAHAKRAKEVRAKLGGGSSSKEAEAES